MVQLSKMLSPTCIAFAFTGKIIKRRYWCILHDDGKFVLYTGSDYFTLYLIKDTTIKHKPIATGTLLNFDFKAFTSLSHKRQIATFWNVINPALPEAQQFREPSYFSDGPPAWAYGDQQEFEHLLQLGCNVFGFSNVNMYYRMNPDEYGKNFFYIDSRAKQFNGSQDISRLVGFCRQLIDIFKPNQYVYTAKTDNRKIKMYHRQNQIDGNIKRAKRVDLLYTEEDLILSPREALGAKNILRAFFKKHHKKISF